MTLVAGVDSSTQSCKVVIRDAATGELVRTGRAAHPAGTEVHPDEWWAALHSAIADAGGLADVAAVAVAGQQHGMVALDSAGRVIRPALLWNDTRSAAAAAALTDEVSPDEYARRTGVVPVASFTAAKLRWLRDAEPENAARVAAVALPHDWLSWRLRGFGPADAADAPLGPSLDALTTDRSDASGTAYWGRDGYDHDLLVRALGHEAVLPLVLDPSSVAGRTPDGAIVGAGAGDNAAAALGLDARPGDVVVSIGTSGTVFAVSERPIADASGIVAGFADATGAWLPLIATLNAARVLDTTARLLGVDHHELGRLALEAPPGASGLVLVPYFDGERTPNLPDATASLTGMTLANTTRSNLARSTVEGLLSGLADGLDAVRDQGVPARRILLIGGAAQNPAVRQIASEVFDIPVAVPSAGEYVANGAARQAAWALTGERPSWPIRLDEELEPNPVRHVRDAYRRARDRTSHSAHSS